MYLPTLFLETLGTDYSKENQRKAFRTLYQEFKKRKKVRPKELICIYDVIKEFNPYTLFNDSEIYDPLFAAIFKACIAEKRGIYRTVYSNERRNIN